MYLIRGLEPIPDVMAAHSFLIELSPQFRDMAAASGIDQEKIDRKIERMEPVWKKAAGFEDSYRDIRIDWGDWGPRHITVPGNACGLDIDEHAFGSYIEGGVILAPHNIDSWAQKKMLLMAFCSVAEDVVLLSRKL